MRHEDIDDFQIRDVKESNDKKAMDNAHEKLQKKVLNNMRKQYPELTSGDLQTITIATNEYFKLIEQMNKFSISNDDLKKFHEWDKNHSCELKKNSGAIGGRLTYTFSPTGLGVITKVICGCGEECDLTDYDSW